MHLNFIVFMVENRRASTYFFDEITDDKGSKLLEMGFPETLTEKLFNDLMIKKHKSSLINFPKGCK
ncbi:hypothetical protein DMB44_03730 [Thermoplasma sp. Kam2015]|nr:hypothetical protein DMB44_03730 [Thermoplasma sp. Kam2015]